jgi:hypothetical protein
LKATPSPRKAPCPRCKFGFIIFESTFDGESTCLNCGYHPPDLSPARTWLSEIADVAALPGLAPSESRPISLVPAKKVA